MCLENLQTTTAVYTQSAFAISGPGGGIEGAGVGGAGGVAAGGYVGDNTGTGPSGLQGATCVNTNVEQNNPNCPAGSYRFQEKKERVFSFSLICSTTLPPHLLRR